MARITARALTGPCSESVTRIRSPSALDADHALHEGEVGAEDPGLLVRLLGEPAAAHAAREAEVVADQRARGGLAAEPALVDDQRAEALRRRRTPRRRGPPAREPTITTSNSLRRGSTAAPPAEPTSASLGVAQDGAVGEDHQRQRRLAVEFREQLTALVGVREAERVRNRAALEHVAQLIGAPRPGVADDVDGVRRDPLRPRPLEQEARDRLMEDLVRASRRAQHVVVDPAVRHGVVDRLAGGAVAPRAPARSAARAWHADEADAPAPSSSVPVIPDSHCAASTSATSAPSCASPPAASRPASGDDPRTRPRNPANTDRAARSRRHEAHRDRRRLRGELGRA